MTELFRFLAVRKLLCCPGTKLHVGEEVSLSWEWFNLWLRLAQPDTVSLQSSVGFSLCNCKATRVRSP